MIQTQTEYFLQKRAYSPQNAKFTQNKKHWEMQSMILNWILWHKRHYWDNWWNLSPVWGLDGSDVSVLISCSVGYTEVIQGHVLVRREYMLKGIQQHTPQMSQETL